MADLFDILFESLSLLKERPSLFVPKVFSTLIGAFWFVGLFSGFGSPLLFLVTAPLISVSGVFAAVMLAVMVKNEEEENLLKKGFFDTLGRWKDIGITVLGLSFVGVLIFVPVMFGLILFLVYGNPLFLIPGIALTLFLLTSLGFLIYFFPISLVEKGSVFSGFRDSAGKALENSPEVFLLTVLSFVLLVLASIAGETEFEVAGYVGFVVMRVISGIITTYIFVVSPKYYLSN